MGDTTYPTFKAIAEDLGVWGRVKLTPYPNVHLTTGAVIRFRTAEDPDKMRGPNLSGIWLDEASLMREDAYKIAIACLREQGEQGWLSATFTPKGLSHWTYQVFGKSAPNTAITHARTRDNPFNPPGFHDTLKLQYGGLLAQQELDGLFVNVEGAEWPAEYFEDRIWFADWPRDLVRKILSLDPSKGKDARFGDYRAYVLLGQARDGTLWVDADLAREPTPRIVETGLELVRTWHPEAFAVEVNQWQELLGADFIRRARELRMPALPIYGINNSVNKEVRIRRLGPYLAQSKMRFKGDSPGARLLVQQLRDFPVGEHDDGPDSLEQGVRMLGYLLGLRDERDQPQLLRAG